jgi:hypothetical protein
MSGGQCGVIFFYSLTSTTLDTGTYTCEVSGVTNIDSISFSTWSDANSKDEIVAGFCRGSIPFSCHIIAPKVSYNIHIPA